MADTGDGFMAGHGHDFGEVGAHFAVGGICAVEGHDGGGDSGEVVFGEVGDFAEFAAEFGFIEEALLAGETGLASPAPIPSWSRTLYEMDGKPVEVETGILFGRRSFR